MASFLLEFYALVFLSYIAYSIIKEVQNESRVVPAGLRPHTASRSVRNNRVRSTSIGSISSSSISSGSSGSSEKSGAATVVSSSRSSSAERSITSSSFAPSFASVQSVKLDPNMDYRRCVRVPRLRNPGLLRYSRPATAVFHDGRVGQQGVRR